MDTDLIPLLSEALREYDNLEIMEADAMKVDFTALVREKFPGEKVSVCANLPYYITSPVIMRLLDSSEVFDSIVVMIQKEVADRLCSQPGSADFGAITLAVTYKAEVENAFRCRRVISYPLQSYIFGYKDEYKRRAARLSEIR